MAKKTLGDRLLWARRDHAQITQKELRDRMLAEYGVEIGRNYISQIESGEGTKPSFAVVRAMAGILGVSMDFLAGFTENHIPAQGEEVTPHYFSPEADEVAQLVDRMRPEQRGVVVSVARNLSILTAERLRRQAEIKDILDSVEKELGREARANYERILRNKGLLVGDT